jgi:glycosyltransferase involved in cell wall biosynthesis
VIGAFHPEDLAAVRAIGRRLSEYRVAVVQHEFEIYGRDDGIAVCDLLDQIAIPLVTVLHTVPSRPTRGQRAIIDCLTRASSAAVVLSRSAVETLEDTYHADASKVAVIPHGSHLPQGPSMQPLRPIVLTWGLISRPKGIEKGIAAMDGLRDLRPCPSYRIVGRTHPKAFEREGERYRSELAELAMRLRLHDVVEFEPSYLDPPALVREVSAARVVLLPFATDQVTSGTLCEALAAGKPVVATRFAHAAELLRTGAGILVDHDDIEGMADALRALLTDSALYDRASREARRVAERISWPEVTRRYADLVGEVASQGGVAVA